MQYALMIHNVENDAADSDPARPIEPDIEAALAHPDVTGWIRLHVPGSTTTVRHAGDETLLTDGPFIDSKEFLGGLVLVEAANLDGAVAIAGELAALRPGRIAAIEVRPVRGLASRGA